MRTTLNVILVFFVFLFHVAASEIIPNGGWVCWPLYFSGITVGFNDDQQIVRLMGEGLFRSNGGDGGERIFTDKKHMATLHAVFYTDNVVGKLTLSDGVEGLSTAEKLRAESLYFDPLEGFGNWRSLHLGSTQGEVLKNIGEPISKDGDGGWKYLTKASCEIQNYFTIYFKSNRINKVVFSAPPG